MITQHYSFRCDVRGCDTEQIDVTTMPMDWEGTGPSPAPPRPVLPVDWTRVNDEIICPKHAVTITTIEEAPDA